MNRLEEAKSLLFEMSTSTIGLPAMSLWFVDRPKATQAYHSIFEGQELDGRLSTSKTLDDKGLIGHFLYNIYLSAPEDDTILSFLKSMFPRVVDHHRFLFNQFGVNEHGLLSVNDVIEPLINSTYIWSVSALIELGYVLGLSSDNLFEQNELAIHSMNELLWDVDLGLYSGYSIKTKKLIENQTATGFLPMSAGVPDIHQVLIMVHRAFGADFRQEQHYSMPSYNLNGPHLDYLSPQLGAISTMNNWLLIQGLQRYDMDDLADLVQSDTLHLLNEYGFFDYFDPRKSNSLNGVGTPNSATAAAIYLDLDMGA